MARKTNTPKRVAFLTTTALLLVSVSPFSGWRSDEHFRYLKRTESPALSLTNYPIATTSSQKTTLFCTDRLRSRRYRLLRLLGSDQFAPLYQRAGLMMVGDDFDFASQSSSEFSDPSVGDYVKGLHGGKYQFVEVGGQSYEAIQFLDQMYGGGAGVSTTKEETSIQVPDWFLRIQRDDSQPHETIAFAESQSSEEDGSTANNKVLVRFKNDERTWEDFFCKLVTVRSAGGSNPDDGVEQPFVLKGATSGTLAPRGSSVSSHSDVGSIVVQLMSMASENNEANVTTWLLVATEEKTWQFKLEIGAAR